MHTKYNFTTIESSKKEHVLLPSMIGVYVFVKGSDPIYVGKATNIKARIKSHFEGAKIDAKERRIILESTHIRFFVTNSDFSALLVESELIQEHHPKYNVRWRDDKSYLYIKITKEDYPKILTVRREERSHSLYFGPFPSRRSTEEILRAIRRIFPFCTQKKLSRHACFYSKIGLCDPCPSYIAQQETGLKRELKRLYRKNVRNVIKVLEGRGEVVLKDLYKEMHVYRSGEQYEKALNVRNKILRFEHLLSNQLFLRAARDDEAVQDRGAAAQALLAPFFPAIAPLERIECYDMSTFSMKDSTASLVVASEGLMDKSEYRKFKIKNLKARSDFEMIREVVARRFKNKWPHPQLILVDGGKPQVRAVSQALVGLEKEIPVVGIAKRPDRLVIGTLDLPTIRPPLHNPGFQLLQQLRDESHRFARKYHLVVRGRKHVL